MESRRVKITANDARGIVHRIKDKSSDFAFHLEYCYLMIISASAERRRDAHIWIGATEIRDLVMEALLKDGYAVEKSWKYSVRIYW